MLKLKKLESYGSAGGAASAQQGPRPTQQQVLAEAGRILTESLQRWPYEPDLHNWAGKFAGYAGRHTEAARAYGRAMSLNPSHLEYRVNRTVEWFRSLPRPQPSPAMKTVDGAREGEARGDGVSGGSGQGEGEGEGEVARPDQDGGGGHLDHLRQATEQALGFIEETRRKVAPYARTEEEGGRPGYAPPGWMGLLGQMAEDLRGRAPR